MNFIEIYDNALTSEMCKAIIHFFDVAPPEDKFEGRTSLGVNKNYKDSLDITLEFDKLTEIDQIIIPVLRTYIEKYKEKHVEINYVFPWSLTNKWNIQKYEPTQAYHDPHCECADGNQKRILAWMIYLNTVTDKGGTRFTNYDIVTDAVEGRLVIWPAYWTHTHHGVASPTQTKYIATGWFQFK